MVTQILINILIALIAGFIGMQIQRYIDNRKRKKDFYMDHYKDMWRVIQNVGGVIRSGRKIDPDKVMNSIRDKYSCSDINAFLTNRFDSDDPKLNQLLCDFSDNLSKYQSEKGRLLYPLMGDGQIDYQKISNDLIKKIKMRIDHYLDK